MQRQPDADVLHPHEEADEEENESSAGVALRNRLVGFINRISSRMSMMSGGSEGPDNAGDFPACCNAIRSPCESSL